MGLMLLTRDRGKMGHKSASVDEDAAAAGCVPGALCDDAGPTGRCPLDVEAIAEDSPVVAPMAVKNVGL